MVLFDAVDSKDRTHEKSRKFLTRLSNDGYYLAGFAMLEFDIVMNSRGLSHNERMLRHALLAEDYPASVDKVRPVSPTTLYLAAKIEDEEKTDYF